MPGATGVSKHFLIHILVYCCSTLVFQLELALPGAAAGSYLKKLDFYYILFLNNYWAHQNVWQSSTWIKPWGMFFCSIHNKLASTQAARLGKFFEGKSVKCCTLLMRKRREKAQQPAWFVPMTSQSQGMCSTIVLQPLPSFEEWVGTLEIKMRR